jgi:hypothetical protein
MRGRCLCGAVAFDATPKSMTFHACHCDMCRRWTGSAMLAVAVPADGMRLEGGEHIRTIASSGWAERGWCDRCGSSLFYRVTIEGPMQGQYHVPLGLFDEPEAFEFTSEIFIDRKPASFAYAGSRRTMTGAEVEAQFAEGAP